MFAYIGEVIRALITLGTIEEARVKISTESSIKVRKEKDKKGNVICLVMLCYVMLYYVMLYYVMLCYIMLCYVMLCYVMLCYVML